MSEELAKIKTLIAKLLAKAEGTSNENEANVFMAKVNELLEFHQLSLYQIRGTLDNDPMGHQRGETNLYASMSWSKLLVSQIGRYYGCRTVWWKEGNHMRYDVIGRQSARITCELMIPFIISQVRQKAKELAKLTRRTDAVAQKEIGHALTMRIVDLIPEVERIREANIANALVPVSDHEAYMNEKFPNLRKGRASKVSYSSSARDLADGISITTAAHNTKVKERRQPTMLLN